ncbi:hypothetical protein BBJ28_00016503 [Nothophytophthora sp. Chile5]|nr:hypothetical protein BBJ28_00016503 [Nothophytophthora sp. Chile5]
MVCEKCEEKLSKLVVPDKWKDGARNTTGGKDGGRAVGKDRSLAKKKSRVARFSPVERKCRLCKSNVAPKAYYCNQCAYKKGSRCWLAVVSSRNGKERSPAELASAEKMEKRQLAQAAYRMGLANLSVELVQKQKELVRLETLKNEVDIFQQHLDPFIFEMRSEHERQVNSSVYRHFLRMRAIQDMGIPIYSLGDYLLEKDDRILTPRTTHSLYRRVRRRSAAHFIDTELIPRPERRRSSVVTNPSAR